MPAPVLHVDADRLKAATAAVSAAPRLDLTVLVVGGSIAGCCTALALRELGAKVRKGTGGGKEAEGHAPLLMRARTGRRMVTPLIRHLSLQVHVFERTTGELQSQGAGLNIQPDMLQVRAVGCGDSGDSSSAPGASPTPCANRVAATVPSTLPCLLKP